jgi:hypothetical protein
MANAACLTIDSTTSYVSLGGSLQGATEVAFSPCRVKSIREGDVGFF